MLLHHERVPVEHQDLLGLRTEMPYTEAERRYSAAIQAYLEELLAGRRQQFLLLRRYYDGGKRIAVTPAPREIDRTDLRLSMVEKIIVATISFIRDVSPGGPILQRESRGQLLEAQHFSTKYPHVIIERLDAFDGESRAPLFTEWRLRRTQNQRVETQINRWLDAANLVLSMLKAVRGER